MSKYIPTDNKPKGQAKPKLKVKVVMNEKETILNEYDAFQMISELKAENTQQNKVIEEMSQALMGVIDGMKAGATGVTSSPSPQQSTAPQPGTLKLPKLNKVSKDKLSGGERFYGSDGGVKLES